MSSAAEYVHTKEWGPTEQQYAFSSGEVGRRGQRTPEAYLDDRTNLKGTRLKLLCRLGALPLMRRVGREVRPPWPVASRV